MTPAMKLTASAEETPPVDRSVGELIGELGAEMTTLLRQEVNLAATEVTRKATVMGRQARVVALGALLGQVSLLTLVAALILGLGQFVALWAAALLVGGALAIVAAVVTSAGVQALKHTDPTPQQTVQSFADNTRWVKEQIR